MRDVTAEIIAIGTEILLGEITDTNSVFLARALRDMGINVYFMTSVGDNERRITEAVKLAMGRAQVVITCGGLGPTVDAMTRQSVAVATERGLAFQQPLLDKIAERFAGFKMPMAENNRQQAFVPEGAIIVENPVGTAPSFIVEHGDNVVLSLPGVPREMKFLFTEKITPYLREKFQLGNTIIKARVLKTAGIGESTLDEVIGKDLLQASNPTVGLAAHSGQVDVRVTAKADSEAEADVMIADFEAKLRARIGRFIFGADGDTLDAALIAALRDSGRQVAIYEAGIEPVVSDRLMFAQGVGEVIALHEHFASANILAVTLGLPPNGSIRELAEGAARSLHEETEGAVAIAVVSREDSDDDHADADERSALAVYDGAQLRSRAYGFGGGSDTAKQFAGTWVMAMAWRLLRDADDA